MANQLKRLTVMTAAALCLVSIQPLAANAQFGNLLSSLGGHHGSNNQDSNSSQNDPPYPPYTGPKKRLAVEALDLKTDADGMSTSSQSQLNSTTIVNSTINAPTGSTGTQNVAGNIPPPADFGTGLTEELTTELEKSGHYILLERSDMADITAEQTLDTSAAADPTSASKPGSLLGAQILVRGAIDEYSYSQSGQNAGGLFGNTTANFQTSKAHIGIDLRLIDASTGVIIDSVDAYGDAKSSGVQLGLTAGSQTFGTSDFNNSPLGQAVRQAIRSAVDQIINDDKLNAIPWESQIADMDSTDGTVSTLYLDCGADSGVKEGDILTIFSPGRTIVSPETRMVIGRTKDTVIGHCTITSVTPSLSVASINDGTKFAIGQLVKYPDEEANQATQAAVH